MLTDMTNIQRFILQLEQETIVGFIVRLQWSFGFISSVPVDGPVAHLPVAACAGPAGGFEGLPGFDVLLAGRQAAVRQARALVLPLIGANVAVASVAAVQRLLGVGRFAR